MTEIAIYGGPLKRDIIQQAFEECGQAGYEFELESEEYESALRRLNAMMAEWLAGYGIDLGYNFPNNGNGSAADESGIPDGAVQTVVTQLAGRIAPSIGKAMSADTARVMAQSFALLRSTYAVTPTLQLRGDTIRGAGNKRRGFLSPFFQPSSG